MAGRVGASSAPPSIASPFRTAGRERHLSMAAIRLRVRLPSGQSTVNATTMGELTAHINDALEAPAAWSLLSGYPPQVVEPLPGPSEALSGFLKSGDTVVVRLGATG